MKPMFSPNRSFSASLKNVMRGLLLAMFAAVVALTVPAGVSAADGQSFVESWEAGVYDAGSGAPGEVGANDPLNSGPFNPLAGAHPFVARTNVRIERRGSTALEYVRDVKVKTPAGLVVNPQAVPTCSREEFYWNRQGDAGLANGGCPPETQVGMVYLAGVLGSSFPVFNLEPRRGVPAEFGFLAVTVPVTVQGQVSSDGTLSAVSLNNSYANNVQGIEFMLFGVPADPAYDTGSTAPRKAFVTTPTSCVGPVETQLTINSWQSPEYEHFSDSTPVGGAGCDQLPFKPKASVESSSGEAGQPTGLEFNLRVPQSDNPDGRATAHIKDVEVQLPEGMKVNPSAADGLAGCSESQVDLGSTDRVSCPDGSKIGSVEIETPLLEESVGGSVYLATPYENPSDSLLGLYVVAENAERGIRLKIPGAVEVDEDSGQLTARFEDNPQLPYGSLRVSFNGGPRAPLMLPEKCGDHEVITRISPWSAVDPDNPTEAEIVEGSSTISVNSNCSQASGFDPDFAAGTESALAGASSPFLMNASRDSADEEFRTLDRIQLPEGLLGHISGVELCEAGAAAQGTCGEGSRIGKVLNAVGAGPRPAWLPQAGKEPTSVHLAGPYRGAPYSLSVVVPAQAGPFDLGRVVVRTPLVVDRVSSALSTYVAESRVYGTDGSLDQVHEGALPTMLDGIPLKLREIRVVVDREGFMVNPTNCRPQAVSANLVSTGGDRVAVSSRYSASACASLDFAPRTVLRMFGKRFTRSSHPPFRATVLGRSGDANIGRSVVALPRSVMLDQGNIRTVCTRPQWAADRCPDAAIYGRAVAWTPLLNEPLRGPVYLRSSDNLLPDLVADLRGPVRLELAGRIDSVRGQMRTSFENVPDAPVSRFVLQMQGGNRKGLLVSNTNLCNGAQRADVRMLGQNGKRANSKSRLHIRRCKQLNRRKAAKRKQAKRQAAKRQMVRRQVARTGRG